MRAADTNFMIGIQRWRKGIKIVSGVSLGLSTQPLFIAHYNCIECAVEAIFLIHFHNANFHWPSICILAAIPREQLTNWASFVWLAIFVQRKNFEKSAVHEISETSQMKVSMAA